MFSSFEDDFKMYLKGHLACHLYRYSYVHLVKPIRGPRLADKYIIIVYIKTFKTQRNVQLKRLISYNFYVYCKNELTLWNIRSTFGFILCLVMVLYIILHHVFPLDLRSQLPGYILMEFFPFIKGTERYETFSENPDFQKTTTTTI